MKILVYCLFFIFLAHSFIAQSFAEDKVTFNGWSRDGFIYENYIEISRLKKMPAWNPRKGNPPISMLKAIEISKNYISEKAPEFNNAEISHVQLTQFLIPKFYKDKWYYNVVFMDNIPIRNSPPRNMSIVVFLDGTIAEVTKRKIQVDKEMLQRMRDNLNKKLNEN